MEAVIMENVWFKYEHGEDYVLQDINLRIKKGEFVAVTGPTAAGKSTLCMCFNGLVPNYIDGKFKGHITVNDKDTAKHSTGHLAREIGIVFQNPESQLYGLTVEEEIIFALENYSLPVAEIRDRLHWALNAVDMYKYKDKSPYELSGGQKQRVIIASTLALRPSILVLDEPTAEIDPVGKSEVFNIVTKLREQEDITIIMVEHDTERIAAFADRVLLVEDGRITRDEKVKDFFQDINHLLKVGVRPPQVCQLFAQLREEGVFTGALPISIQEGQKELAKLLGGGTGGAD